MESVEEYLLTPLATSTPFSAASIFKPKPQRLTSYTRLYSESLHPVLSNRASNDVQTHRQRIVKEIFDTEHAYISQLNTVIVLFLKPIRVGCLLPSDIISTIFSNIEAILSVNQELFFCMRQHSLGEAFTYLGPFLKLYSTYANNFQNANSVLQDWLRNSNEVHRFISVQESRPECRGLALSSLLITPVQRIPRYKLLLNDLLQHTKQTHADYGKLSAAAAQIESIASHINEFIRQHENFSKMLEIQNSLTGQRVPGILAPARKFIHEGRLMKICYRKAKERVIFLFSDILIYAKPKLIKTRDQLRKYECRCVFPLLNSTIEVVDGDHRAPGAVVLMKISNVDTTLLFFSDTAQEVFNWVQVIQDAIESLRSAFGHTSTTPEKDEHLEVGQRESSPRSATMQQQLDLGTLTPRTPYPLTATLFSMHAEHLPIDDLDNQTKSSLKHRNTDLMDSAASERQRMITERFLGLSSESRCCVIS